MSAPRYRVLGDCVLIQPEPDPTYAEYMQYTHVQVPEAFQAGPIDPPKWGRILTCGARTTGVVRVGDRVLYGKFAWAKLPLDDGTYYAIVRERDLLAIDTDAWMRPCSFPASG